MHRVKQLTARLFRTVFLLICVLVVIGARVEGHAILKSSSPASGGSVKGPGVEVMLTFNVRVDAARSKLEAGSWRLEAGHVTSVPRL